MNCCFCRDISQKNKRHFIGYTCLNIVTRGNKDKTQIIYNPNKKQPKSQPTFSIKEVKVSTLHVSMYFQFHSPIYPKYIFKLQYYTDTNKNMYSILNFLPVKFSLKKF